MVRGIEMYVILWMLVIFGIISFRQLTGKEKWELVKVITFGGITAAIAAVAVTVIVAVF